MSTHDFTALIQGRHVLDRTRSIFEVGTRASRMIAAAQDSIMSVTSDIPVGHKVRVGKKKKNTYQLNPKEKFKPFKATDIATDVVNKWIAKDTIYNVEWARTTAKAIAEDVKNVVKQLNHDRYKLIVQVFIGQKMGQGVEICSRCMSDVNTDSFSQFSFQNDSLWCVVLTSAMYFE